MRKSRKKKLLIKSPDNIIEIIMVLAIIWFVCSALFSGISNLLTKTAIVGKETVEEVCSIYGLVEPQCFLLASPVNGQGTGIVLEGERVRKNEAVFQVRAAEGSAMQSEGEQIIYAPVSGIVSYKIDGYETVDSLEKAAMLNYADLYKQKMKANVKHDQTAAKADMPYAKIVNNIDGVYLFLDCDKNTYTDTFEVDMKIRVRFPDLNYSTLGRITALKNQTAQGQTGERLWVQLDMGTVEQTLLMNDRIVKVDLPYNTERIIDVPKQALVYRNDQPGVYVLQKGFAVWQEIKITSEKEKAVVTDSLPEGTEIVTTPKFVGEGDKVKVK